MQTDIARLEYLHGMSAQLAQLAKDDGMDTLSYLYSLAEHEASLLLINLGRTIKAKPKPRKEIDPA